MKTLKKMLMAVLIAATVATSAAPVMAATPSNNTVVTPKAASVKKTVNTKKKTKIDVSDFADGQKATYKSSNKKITVSKKGVVSAPKGYVGTAKITITRADGTTRIVNVTIRPTSTKVTSLKAKAKKHKLTVTWKKNKKVSGYQVQYAKKGSASAAETVTVTKKTTVRKTVTVKKGTYWVRIRTYKTVKGKKIYSAWSTRKTVKVK